MPNQSVFIVGPGFIGWPVLRLLIEEGYRVTGLVRREAHGAAIERSGATAVYGDLTDDELLTRLTTEHDITLHTATADDLPSVQAVLAGVRARVAAGRPALYIHTSGTSVLDDGSAGRWASETVYRDDARAMIEAIPVNAPHRAVDLAIVAAQQELGDRAKIAIMTPPDIYGYNAWNGRLSIQVPTLTRYAIKHGYAPVVGEGASIWSQVHVNDLARGYMTLLHYMEANSPQVVIDNPYFFCENGREFTWKEAAENVAQGLATAGILATPEVKTIKEENFSDLFDIYTETVLGNNSRSRAIRLRALGWEPREKDIWASYHEDELPVLVKEDCSNFAGYAGPVASGK